MIIVFRVHYLCAGQIWEASLQDDDVNIFQDWNSTIFISLFIEILLVMRNKKVILQMFTILFFVFNKSIEVLIQRRTESFVVFISCLSKVRDMETSVNHVMIKCRLNVDLSGLSQVKALELKKQEHLPFKEDHHKDKENHTECRTILKRPTRYIDPQGWYKQ